MQKLQDAVFSITKTTSLSPAVFSFLQPTEEFTDKTPLGGILSDTRHGWLALGPKFCVVDLRSGLKIAARIFGNGLSSRTSVTSVVELPTPLSPNSQQLVISLDCDDVTGMICVFHINGSQLLHCIQTDVVVTELAVCDDIPSGPFMCFDGLVTAGTRRGEVLVFDLNRSCLVDALKNISQGEEDEIHNEVNAANLVFLPLKAVHKIETQRDLAIDNNDHLAVLLNETSMVDGQYIFRNPDGTVRMKAKRDHIRVTVVHYIPQLASLAVGYNFGAFQIWNLLNIELEFTSQVNVECLPVTHFGFQEPCDDPRAFCYLWVVFSVIDRFEEEEFPLAVMYSLTYQGKRMLSENACLYQEFSTATIRFQVELSTLEESSQFVGGRCVSCHTYSVNSTLGDEEEDSIFTNICQIVWECWGEHANSSAQHGMLLFDLDQWYKDQMPATHRLESNAFLSATWCTELARGSCLTLDVRLDPGSVAPYSHATRLEEHFYPNSLQYNCICLNTSEAMVLHTVGIQRQIINSLAEAGPSCLLSPARLRAACATAGLTPLYRDGCVADSNPEEQRRYLLSVALEARLSSFLKRCAHDWATGTHSGSGCTLPFLVDWCWKRAIELKENAKELTAPLFTSSTLPDRNVVRCLEHCVQQLTQLTGLLDAVLTKCCNLVVPDALSEMEEKYKGIGTVALYFQVVQWFLRVGLLPDLLPYPAHQLYTIYKKRRLKLQRLEDKVPSDNEHESCSLLYIDQLIEHEFGGERTRQMWVRGGSESGGLYPPPSLYALLRLYLLPDVPEEHKHSLVLYLLVDYSMVYDEIRYEEVIRRLMQFPTMFGLSNTAIKATQAFWHLDHRDFDFALDQLQCLTGNTLSEWQHNVVLSSLLAQKKTQAALQYLHVRKPAPIQNLRDKDTDYNRISDHDKLEDWQSCCNLYLARGLVFEALDVIRMCVQNAGSLDDKVQVLNFFYKGCRNTGQLCKILNVTLLPFEEDVFIKYLQNCNEAQTSDILIMYYLQQARYLEAEQYNNRIKSKGRPRELSTSAESLLDVMDREGARDTLVEVVCSALPQVANSVARCARVEFEPHIIAPKPMSVFVQARSPKNTFTYKSSFIQDTIENASETWVNKPQMRRGIKRALEVEETPFICTPKLFKTKSIFSEQQGTESTPPKRAKFSLSGTPRTPRAPPPPRGASRLARQMAALLDMPEALRPGRAGYGTRSGAGTPQSILKNRRLDGQDREAPSPVDSRYLGDSEDELLETGSNHTLYSDSKHLRFTIPTASEGSTTPSPVQPVAATAHIYTMENDNKIEEDKEDEVPPAVSPPKKLAVEELKPRKSYKDTVKARRSLSISANSSLSEDPNTSIESIADIPITLINPKYSGEKRLRERTPVTEMEDNKDAGGKEMDTMDRSIEFTLPMPRTPQSRKSIRNIVETTPLINRSRSATPERVDSPVVTPLHAGRITRSRSRTPELSPRLSPLAPIPELPKQESNSEPHPTATMLSVPRALRSRSRTPERIETATGEMSRLEPITESPTKTADIDIPVRPSSRRSLRHRSKTPERLDKEADVSKLEAIKESPVVSSNTDLPQSSPTRRSLRSRSRTPEVEVVPEQPVSTSPRSMRSRSKTPEKLMSPKKENTRSKKSLSRIVLEANAFAKSKQNAEKTETETESIETEEVTESAIECTPMKSSKEPPKLMDMTFSPIVNKSVLQSSSESIFSMSSEKIIKSTDESITGFKPLPAFTTISETYVEKSVLHSYQSSVTDISSICVEEEKIEVINKSAPTDFKTLPAFNTINETGFGKSILKSFQSSMAESSADESRFEKMEEMPKTFSALKSLNETDFGKSVLRSEDSSVAITSDESFGSNRKGQASKNMSSLMTDDSDIEMKEWSHKIDLQETARVIQKEKEKINEIQQEINEIEDDMMDECQVEHETDSDDDAVDEDSDSDAESSYEAPSENVSESGGEIISIADSDESSDAIPIPQNNKATVPTESKAEPEVETIQTVEMQVVNEVNVAGDVIEVSTDPLNQAQRLDVANADVDTEAVKLNYSDEAKPEQEVKEDGVTKETVNQDAEMENGQNVVEVEVIVQPIEPEVDDKKEEAVSTDVDVVDAMTPVQKPAEIEISATKQNDNIPTKSKTMITQNIEEKVKEDVVQEVMAVEKSLEETKKGHEKEAEQNNLGDVTEEKKSEETVKETIEQESETIAPTTPSRKRTKSTSSTKSTNVEKSDTADEPRTPRTRKRTQSNASNKSTTEEPNEESKVRGRAKTPIDLGTITEEQEGKTKGRAKTPTTELRKILTRRASREIELDDSMSEDLTPTRRSTRSRSKQDDNASVASGDSVKSKGKGSDVKASPGRKGRKKPDLTVIPEVTAEDSGLTESTGDIIDAYSGSRRLTRHQKSVLESWLEPPGAARSDDDDDVTPPAFHVQPIDRISLLNKTDFDGPPDEDEMRRTESPLSFLSETRPRNRLARAASESKTTPKPARVTRKASVDVVSGTPELGSPLAGGSSPSRNRRASFNRACEALHTPKGRRTSVDVKNTDSQPGSPAAEGSPARRARRTPSASSAASAGHR
ncbi:uncharacterized protein Elys [Epargyreus clarus]|uniref:uncharacterized protein Elys n=1 Tax=Epargyreus clarus TaxID=520877 RepID=UPI003C2BFB76